MNRLFFLCCFAFVLFAAGGCLKNSTGYSSCTGIAPADDSTALLQFARADSITPVKDSSGVYYQVINPGTGPAPNANSRLFVSYTGKLMNGTIIDSTTDYARTGFVLGSLITGWQIGIPKIQAGGHIKLLIPSALAYGCQGKDNIPPNSPLYFDITLVSFQ